MTIVRIAALVAAIAAADPEHARLTAMCGTWDVELTFRLQPGRPPITTRGTSTIRPLFDGRFIEEKIEGVLNGAPFTTLAWTGFNTATKRYEATRIASTNTIRIAETGTFDDKTNQFELKANYPLAGDTWHQRTIIQPLSADTMVAASYLSFGNVPEWKSVEIKYARRQTAAPGRAGWTAPRTPDGQPDLQGIWTNATITPFERPANLRDKAFLTPAEVESLERQAAQRRDEDGPPRPGDVGSYNQVWFDSGNRVVATRRSSLVIDPPDGRVPLTADAEAARDYNNAHERDSYEFMSVWDRCITRGVPGGLFPAGYNNAYQIVQAPGYVVIHYEMIHEARIIPIDSRPHVPGRVRLWNGDPRGRWEGDTLIVETTNYNNKGWIATQAAAGRIKGVPQTEALHVVERFTPRDANTIDYQVTIEDPKMFTQPWTLAIPLHRDPTYQIFEYACHEGNRSVENILRDARALEKQPGK